ncbi:hypothetical protein AVEN_261775-1 [Araneus ventricosus]|uniref:Uncharacterized protein n=1 Tax=Araneus ventricosus TaxID=182803 RepID=A0A4Y2LYW6_ARAVE|nr:hypothetical protein AVEN_261775-1 [Araneus ventricosus]
MLYRYEKAEEMERFMERWFSLLETYSKRSHFVSFDPPEPILNRLEPDAVGVLVVPYQNHRIPCRLRHVSILPLYPFRIHYAINVECSRDGFEMIRLYLKATGIELIGFFGVPIAPQKMIPELREAFPKVKLYGPDSFSSFRAVCQREALKRM